MERRKSARLALCALEALRSGAAYIAFVGLFGGESLAFARFGAAALFAPQLAIPVAWFLLWYDFRHFRPFLGLIAVAKALSLVAGIAWIYVLAGNSGAHGFLDRKLFLSEFLVQMLIIITDVSILAIALISEKAAARIEGFEGKENAVLRGAAYSGPDRIEGGAGSNSADDEGPGGTLKGGEA
jgi:hypothetical protein